jgi:hypothetical protein
MARKPTDIVQLKVRLPEELRWRMEAEAARNNCSMNAEIVARLKHSLLKNEDDARRFAEMLVASLDPAIVNWMISIMGSRVAADLQLHQQTDKGEKK